MGAFDLGGDEGGADGAIAEGQCPVRQRHGRAQPAGVGLGTAQQPLGAGVLVEHERLHVVAGGHQGQGALPHAHGLLQRAQRLFGNQHPRIGEHGHQTAQHGHRASLGVRQRGDAALGSRQCGNAALGVQRLAQETGIARPAGVAVQDHRLGGDESGVLGVLLRGEGLDRVLARVHRLPLGLQVPGEFEEHVVGRGQVGAGDGFVQPLDARRMVECGAGQHDGLAGRGHVLGALGEQPQGAGGVVGDLPAGLRVVGDGQHPAAQGDGIAQRGQVEALLGLLLPDDAQHAQQRYVGRPVGAGVVQDCRAERGQPLVRRIGPVQQHPQGSAEVVHRDLPGPLRCPVEQLHRLEQGLLVVDQSGEGGQRAPEVDAVAAVLVVVQGERLAEAADRQVGGRPVLQPPGQLQGGQAGVGEGEHARRVAGRQLAQDGPTHLDGLAAHREVAGGGPVQAQQGRRTGQHLRQERMGRRSGQAGQPQQGQGEREVGPAGLVVVRVEIALGRILVQLPPHVRVGGEAGVRREVLPRVVAVGVERPDAAGDQVGGAGVDRAEQLRGGHHVHQAPFGPLPHRTVEEQQPGRHEGLQVEAPRAAVGQQTDRLSQRLPGQHVPAVGPALRRPDPRLDALQQLRTHVPPPSTERMTSQITAVRVELWRIARVPHSLKRPWSSSPSEWNACAVNTAAADS